MTSEQIVLMGLFDTVKAISKGQNTADDIISIHIAHLLKSFPYASEVKCYLTDDGDIIIVEADEKIFDIVGYTPDEMRGKPLSIFETGETTAAKRIKIFEDLQKYGVSVKQNKNKHKDGSTVDTFGWLFKVSPNNYREVVMKKENVR